MQCYQPVLLTKENYFYKNGIEWYNNNLYVPCGKCLACRSARAREWSMRFSQEWNFYKESETLFLTLTYDNEHLSESVHQRELQLYFKKVRRYFDSKRHLELHGLKKKPRIMYLACGEYGKQFGRAHYHAIIFGLKNELQGFRKINRVNKAKCLTDLVLYKKWSKGGIAIGYCSNKSIQYCAQYGLKSALGTHLDRKTYFDRYKREKPFLLVSKGVGKRYALANAASLMENLYIQFGEAKVSIPRQYMIWLEKAGYRIHDKLVELSYIKRDEEIRNLYFKYGYTPKTYLDFASFEDYFDITKHERLLPLWWHSNRLKKLKYESRHKNYLEMKDLFNHIQFEEEVA